MVVSTLIWFVRISVIALLVAAILPVFPSGRWFIRLWAFPRIQLAVLSLVPLVALSAIILKQSWQHEYGALLVVLLLTTGWQLAHVLPFTFLWPTEVNHYQGDSDKVFRLVVLNLKVDNPESNEVEQVIRELDADLLLLIEIDEAWRDALGSVEAAYPYRVGIHRDEGLGIVLWSKLELADEQVRYLVSERRASIKSRIKLSSGRHVNFVGIHPTPPGLVDSTEGGRRDSRVRDAELVLVAREVAAEPNESWIVAGDFNDVAWSHTTRLFKRISGLKDPRVGRRLLNTYHAEYPLLRYPLDHVFLSPDLAIQQLTRHRTPGSDHFGVLADVVPASSQMIEPTPSPEDQVESAEFVEEGKKDAKERDVESK